MPLLRSSRVCGLTGLPSGRARFWFQCLQLVTPHSLIAMSFNFAPYADMSGRVMAILAGFPPEQEVYSIRLIP